MEPPARRRAPRPPTSLVLPESGLASRHGGDRFACWASLERAQACALMTGQAELLLLASDMHFPGRCAHHLAGKDCACRFNPFLGLSQSAERPSDLMGTPQPRAQWRPVWLVLVPEALLVFSSGKAGPSTSSSAAASDALHLHVALALGGEASVAAVGAREWQCYAGFGSDGDGSRAAVTCQYGNPSVPSPSASLHVASSLVHLLRCATQGEMAAWLCAVDAVVGRLQRNRRPAGPSPHKPTLPTPSDHFLVSAIGAASPTYVSANGTREHADDDDATSHMLSDNQMLALPDAWEIDRCASLSTQEERLLQRLAPTSSPTREVRSAVVSEGRASSMQRVHSFSILASLNSAASRLSLRPEDRPSTHSVSVSSAYQQHGTTNGSVSPFENKEAGSCSSSVTGVTRLLETSSIRDALQRIALAQEDGLEALLQFWCHARAFELAHPLTASLCPHLIVTEQGERRVDAVASFPSQGSLDAGNGPSTDVPSSVMVIRGHPVSLTATLALAYSVTLSDASSVTSQAQALLSRFLTPDPLDQLLLLQAAGQGDGSFADIGAGAGLDGDVSLSASGIVLAHVPTSAITWLQGEVGPAAQHQQQLQLQQQQRAKQAASRSPLLAGVRLASSGPLAKIRQQQQQLHSSLLSGAVGGKWQASSGSSGASFQTAMLVVPPPDCFTAARLAAEGAIARKLLQPLAFAMAIRFCDWCLPAEVVAVKGAEANDGRFNRRSLYFRGGRRSSGGPSAGAEEDPGVSVGSMLGSSFAAIQRRLSVGASQRNSSNSVAPRSRTMASSGTGGAIASARRATVSLKPAARGREALARPSALLTRGASTGSLVPGAASGRRTVSFYEVSSGGSSTVSDTSAVSVRSADSDFAATSAAASVLPLKAALEQASVPSSGPVPQRGSWSSGAARRTSLSLGISRRASVSRPDTLSRVRGDSSSGGTIGSAGAVNALTSKALMGGGIPFPRRASRVGGIAHTCYSTGSASAPLGADGMPLPVDIPVPPPTSMMASLARDCLAEAALTSLSSASSPSIHFSTSSSNRPSHVPGSRPHSQRGRGDSSSSGASFMASSPAISAGSISFPSQHSRSVPSSTFIPHESVAGDGRRRVSTLSLSEVPDGSLFSTAYRRPSFGQRVSFADGQDRPVSFGDAPTIGTSESTDSEAGVLPLYASRSPWEPRAALALLRSFAPSLISSWRKRWERVRKSTVGDNAPPPVYTCSRLACDTEGHSSTDRTHISPPSTSGGIAVDRSVLVLLMHKYRVPVRLVVPFIEPAIRAALPSGVSLPITPDGKVLGSSVEAETDIDSKPSPGSWAAVWSGTSDSSNSGASDSSFGLDGSNTPLQDAAAMALLISHELQQLSRDEERVGASVEHKPGSIAAYAAAWRGVTASDLTLPPGANAPAPISLSGVQTPLRRRSSAAAVGDDSAGTPLSTPRGQPMSASASQLQQQGSTSRDATPSAGKRGVREALSPKDPLPTSTIKTDKGSTVPAAVASVAPSAQPSWLGVHPVMPQATADALAHLHSVTSLPLVTGTNTAALPTESVSGSPTAPTGPVPLDRGSRVAKLAGNASVPTSTLSDYSGSPAVLPLFPGLPVHPSLSGCARVLWTPVLTALGADPSGSVYVSDDARVPVPFSRRLAVTSCAPAGHSRSSGALAIVDVDFSAGTRSLLDTLVAHASKSRPTPLLATIQAWGPVLTFQVNNPAPLVAARLVQLLQAASKTKQASVALGALSGMIGCLHLGSADVLDVAPCRDTFAPAHAMEIVLPTGHLTLVLTEATSAREWLANLQAAARDAKRTSIPGDSLTLPVPLGEANGYGFSLLPPARQPVSSESAQTTSSSIVGASRKRVSKGDAGEKSSTYSPPSSLESLFPRLRLSHRWPANVSSQVGSAPSPALGLFIEVDKRGLLNREYKKRLLRVMLQAHTTSSGSGLGADDGTGASSRLASSVSIRPEALLATQSSLVSLATPPRPYQFSPSQRRMTKTNSFSLAIGAAKDDSADAVCFVVTHADRLQSRRAWGPIAARHVGLAWADTVILAGNGSPRMNPCAALVAASTPYNRLPRGATVPLPFAMLAEASDSLAGSPAQQQRSVVISMSAQADYLKPVAASAAAHLAGGFRDSGTLRGSIPLVAAPVQTTAGPSTADNTAAASSSGNRVGQSVSMVHRVTATLLDADPVSVGNRMSLIGSTAAAGAAAGGGGNASGAGPGLLSRMWRAATGGQRGAAGGTGHDAEDSDWARGSGSSRKRSGTIGSQSSSAVPSTGEADADERAHASRASGPSTSSSQSSGSTSRDDVVMRLQPQVVLKLATRDRTWELKVAQPHAAAALASLLRLCGPVRQGNLPIAAVTGDGVDSSAIASAAAAPDDGAAGPGAPSAFHVSV